jgi:hypothetical protein
MNKLMEQAGVLERLQNKDITQQEAGIILQLSSRTIRRKLKKYRLFKGASLHHGNAGRPNPRRFSDEHAKLAVKLIQGELHGAGPTYLAEKMYELHGIKVSDETLRKLLIRRNIWQITKHRPKHRKRRQRRTNVGMLTQLDGSPHDWFEGRAPACTLLVFIDDATSRLMWLEFVAGESCEGAMTAAQKYFKKHGRPIALYVDYGGVWSVNTNNPEREKLTQFERAVKELDIQVIHANSPQAKGRVERSNKTLQDRLIKDMRLKNICSMEGANKFAQEVYIEHHNAKFAVQAADLVDLHRSVDGFNLYNIMSYQETRQVQNDYTITYYKRIFQIGAIQRAIIRPKNDVVVSVHLDGNTTLSIRGILLDYKVISSRPEKQVIPPQAANKNAHRQARNDSFAAGVPVPYRLKHQPQQLVSLVE